MKISPLLLLLTLPLPLPAQQLRSPSHGQLPPELHREQQRLLLEFSPAPRFRPIGPDGQSPLALPRKLRPQAVQDAHRLLDEFRSPAPGFDDFPGLRSRSGFDTDRVTIDADKFILPDNLRDTLDKLPEFSFGPLEVQTVPPPPPAAEPNANPPPAPAPAPAPSPAPAAPAVEKPVMQMTPAKLAVGEQGTLTIRVMDGRGLQSYPQNIEAEGLNIEYSGTASSAYSRNGVTMRSVEFQYRVEAIAPGTHTVAGQTLSIGGKTLTTDPIEVIVTEGQPLDEAIMPQAQLTVNKTELWEGEEVGISVAVLLHGSIQPTSQPFPVIKSEGVAVSRFDRHGRTEAREVNGQYWSAWSLPSSVLAIKSGELTFGPAEVKLEVLMPVGNAQRDPFGGFPSMRRTLNIKSNSIKLNVKPLPAKGRPKDFTGLVGKFQVTARADGQTAGPQRVPLGDPVGFEIIVSGMGNFDAVGAPALENSENLRPFKAKVTMDSRSYGVAEGQKMFSQIIFPEKPGSSTVVFVLPYFDPATGTYLTAKSTPVELLVTGEVAPPAAPDAATPAGADARDFAATVKTPVPGEELTDILPNAIEGGRWYSATATVIPVHPLLLHGLPAAIVALSLGAGGVRRYRLWVLANRPPADAPRKCADILTDLRGNDLTRLQFYGLVSEYVRAWQFWKRSPLPLDAGLAGVLAARDHWLYATNAEPAAQPVPRDEQSQAASVLSSRLSA